MHNDGESMKYVQNCAKKETLNPSLFPVSAPENSTVLTQPYPY